MYHKNVDLDTITRRLNWSGIVLISKKILKLRENMLYFHNTVVPVYTDYAKLLQYKV